MAKVISSGNAGIAPSEKQHFSVIIPTLNEEKLISQCLNQFSPELKNQFGIEVIVSDGGSRDATLAAAAKYSDHLVTNAETSHRQTIAEGRNKGASIAKGDILVFLNADTRFPNATDFFQRILWRMSGDSSLSALAVKVQVHPEERRLSDKLFHGLFNLYVHWLNIVGIGMGRGECQIVRHTAFNAVHGYNETLAAGEDFEFYKRIHHLGKLRFDGKLLVYESPRRYRKYGYLKVYSQWIKNGFSVLLKKKSSSNVWEEVR